MRTGYWFHGFVVADPGEEFQQSVADGKIKMYPSFSWYGDTLQSMYHCRRCHYNQFYQEPGRRLDRL